MSNPHLIGGRYELGELLGRGGMAEVRKGVDTRLGRAVAIKRLRTDLASDATFQARFRREAQSAASLNHPMIVAVYDTGEEWNEEGPDNEGVAQPYIVMEYVAGRTLREILREGRKILPERALEITSGVLSALDYSHRAGIIHRDIKPGNVMLTPSGEVKVMDFGIARAVSDASSSMTQTAAVVGTAQYLSPEQARGETVDSRSDVYSAGCLLYELLTGRPPFVGDSPISVAYQHVRENPQPPSDFDTEIPPEIDAIVMKSLAKRVEERYQSAAAMRTDIERYLAGRPVHAPAVPPPSTTVLAPLPIDDGRETTASQRPVEQSSGGGAAQYFLWGFVIIAVLAGLFWLGGKYFFEEEPEQARVPNLIGLKEQAARAAVTDAGLDVGDVTYEASTDAAKDEVISQSPDRDQYVDLGTAVDFVVSSGKPMVTVPSVVTMQRAEARATLEAQNLKVRFVVEDADEPKGQVLSSDPAAGQEVPEGTLVTVKVSDGPETVPDVVGLDEATATQRLEAAGFKVFVARSSDTTEPKGTVLEQSPTGEQPQGTTVTIVVSTFEEPTETPTPTPTDTPTDTATAVPTDTATTTPTP